MHRVRADVDPIRLKNILATRRVEGDRDFHGHGPRVQLWANIGRANNGVGGPLAPPIPGDPSRALGLALLGSFEETRPDHTTFKLETGIRLWETPAGITIEEVENYPWAVGEYVDDDHAIDSERNEPALLKMIHSNPTIKHIEVVGDTRGDDFGKTGIAALETDYIPVTLAIPDDHVQTFEAIRRIPSEGERPAGYVELTAVPTSTPAHASASETVVEVVVMRVEHFDTLVVVVTERFLDGQRCAEARALIEFFGNNKGNHYLGPNFKMTLSKAGTGTSAAEHERFYPDCWKAPIVHTVIAFRDPATPHAPDTLTPVTVWVGIQDIRYVAIGGISDVRQITERDSVEEFRAIRVPNHLVE